MENDVAIKSQSFGDWIQSRRQALQLTRSELADEVGCAAVTLKKIERDERRPSRQLAQLLAEHLAIPRIDQGIFMQMARGEFVPYPSAHETALRLPPFLQPDTPQLIPTQMPFVERRQELARLAGYLQQASTGNGLPVFILGDAGSGKTSLMREFARRSQETYPSLLAVSGQCNAQTGPGDPYRPFRDILGILTGDLDILRTIGMLNRTQALQIWAAIPDIVQAIASTAPHLVNTLLQVPVVAHRLAPYLGGNAGWFDRFQALAQAEEIKPSGLDQDLVLEEMTRLLRTIAAQTPLLLILDDLQWVDNASLNLLSHLGRRLAGSRILLLGAYRTGDRLSEPPQENPPDRLSPGAIPPVETLILELTRHYGQIQINLDQASPSEGKAFIKALCDLEPNRLGDAFLDRLFQRTQGHPLFTVEVLRSMQENNNLIQDERGNWVENPSSLPPPLPARVEAAIEQRLRRLKPELRELLNVASVEGDPFTAEIAAVILGLDLPTVLQRLSGDLGKRFHYIQEQGELQVRSLRLNRFQFHHMLFQEYLYDQLGSAEKHRLHRQVAEELEKILLGAGDGPLPAPNSGQATTSGEQGLVNQDDLDAFGPALLHHFELGGVWSKAAVYAQRLGNRALQRYAMREAIAYFGQALRSLDHQAGAAEEQIYEALLGWEEAAFRFTTYQEQLEQLSRAEAIARKLGDKPRLIQALHWTANVYLARGLWTKAGPALTECLALAEELGNEHLSVRPIYFKALMTTFSDPPEALEWIARAGDLARKYHDLDIEAIALATQGQVYAQLGEFAQSRQALTRAHRVSQRLGSPLTESDVDLFAAWAYLAMGHREQALEFGQSSVSMAISTDNMDCICNGMACLGYINLELGKIPEATSAFEKGIERSDISGAMIPKLNGQAGLAMTRFLTGRKEAVDELERVVATMNQYQHYVGAASANTLLGICLGQLGAFERAAAALNQAITFYRNSRMYPYLAKALFSLAGLLEQQGRQAEAQQSRAEAEALHF